MVCGLCMYIVRSVLLTIYYPGDQIENEMGWECRTCWGEEESCIQGVDGEA